MKEIRLMYILLLAMLLISLIEIGYSSSFQPIYPGEAYVGKLTPGVKATVVLGDDMPSYIDLIGSQHQILLGLDEYYSGIKIIIRVIYPDGRVDESVVADKTYNKIVVEHISRAAIQFSIYKDGQFYDSFSLPLKEDSWAVYACNVENISIENPLLNNLVIIAIFVIIIVFIALLWTRKKD